ncbi:MAG: DNA polymerase IV [Gemmatimonadaceae bacterium]|nr:DNA polymerase IV [Gemmatimonadaceae bacterium]
MSLSPVDTPHSAPRRILLVDADAFFVAVARQEDPEGAGRAALLIVGGRPGSRGVVCSASYECRAFGVRSAMSIARALQLCPDALCVPVPRRACGQRSKDIARVLAQFAPVVQASSIDEWYCDMAGTEALYHNEPLAETAHRIRRAVFEQTGLHVSIGGGTSRLVAKMAVEVGKPKPGSGADGVCCVAPGDEVTFLQRFRLGDLPMVGPKFAETLARMSLETVADGQRWSREALVSRLGERAGSWLYRRVRGIDDSIVAPRESQKQVSREETFADDLHDQVLIERELLRLAVRVSADLRHQSLRARTVTVKLRDTDFKTRSAQRTLRLPIESERSVAKAASGLLAQLRSRRRVGVRLLGIALSHFDEIAPMPEQLAFFEAPRPVADDEPVEGERERALTVALDRIRNRFGVQSIVPAPLVGGKAIGPRVEE